MKLKFARLAVMATAMVASMAAHATIVTVFDDIPTGTAAYNATVAGAGAMVSTATLPVGGGASIVTPDFTITRNNGGNVSTSTYGTMTGRVININPQGSGRGIGGISSGVTFTFNSPVNSIGFEVGDWATCCEPSGLYISFDGGAPITVGDYLGGPTEGTYSFGGAFEVFVAAFDDTADFTTVQFWGDGYGEFLVVGGTISYALLGQGTLPPTGVPEPGSLALAGLALAGLAASRRRKQAA